MNIIDFENQMILRGSWNYKCFQRRLSFYELILYPVINAIFPPKRQIQTTSYNKKKTHTEI